MNLPRLAPIVLAFALVVAGRGLASDGTGAPVEPASAAPLRLALADSAGATHTHAEWAGSRAIVMFFVTPDCPISQGYVPEMNRLDETYSARGVRFYAVQTDVAFPLADLRRHVTEYGYRFPVLLDPAQRLVAHTGATITPEAVVMTPAGRVLYQGRIDNRIASLGTKRVQATELDLRNALDAVLAGRPVVRAKTTAYGCIISKRT